LRLTVTATGENVCRAVKQRGIVNRTIEPSITGAGCVQRRVRVDRNPSFPQGHVGQKCIGARGHIRSRLDIGRPVGGSGLDRGDVPSYGAIQNGCSRGRVLATVWVLKPGQCVGG
jgi:hypothetical protein